MSFNDTNGPLPNWNHQITIVEPIETTSGRHEIRSKTYIRNRQNGRKIGRYRVGQWAGASSQGSLNGCKNTIGYHQWIIYQLNLPNKYTRKKMERSLRVVKDGQRQKYKGQQTQNPGYNDTFNRKRPITYLKMSWNVTNGSLPYWNHQLTIAGNIGTPPPLEGMKDAQRQKQGIVKMKGK